MALKSAIELQNRVREQGVVTIRLDELRNAFGFQRLGANVRWEIAQSLRQAEIDFVPPQLPNRDHEMIRLFDKRLPIPGLLKAAVELDPEMDQVLAEAARGIKSPVSTKRRVGRPKRTLVPA